MTRSEESRENEKKEEEEEEEDSHHYCNHRGSTSQRSCKPDKQSFVLKKRERQYCTQDTVVVQSVQGSRRNELFGENDGVFASTDLLARIPARQTDEMFVG